jgi:hypothetical protein
MVKSVIVFDEVQSLPIHLVVPTLSRLSHRFGSSIAFATATQPAFTHLDDKIKTLCSAGWSARPMIDFANELFEQTANRTHVEWRIDEPTRFVGRTSRANWPATRTGTCSASPTSSGTRRDFSNC